MPWTITGMIKEVIRGNPNERHISTSYVEVCRVHGSIRVTPAMEAGLSDHVWEIEELIALLDSRSAVAA